MSLSAVIIAKNEERNIAECLESLGFCDEIIVLDSGSVDRTVSIASQRAKVFQKDFEDFAAQKNYAIAQASMPWILSIDADERVTPALAEEIKRRLTRPDADGYYLLRRNRLFGRWMRYGMNKRDYQLRLVRKEKAIFRRRVHERIEPPDKVAHLRNELLHYSTDTIHSYMIKLNVYSSLEAQRSQEAGELFSLGRTKRRPLLLFVYLALWKRGVLDGIEGFFFAVLSAYNEFVRFAKQWELDEKFLEK